MVLAATMRSTGADVVLGSRRLGRAESMPRLRHLILRLAVIFTRLHSGLGVSNTHNGLRLFTRAAALGLRITQQRMAHVSELLAQIGSSKLPFAGTPVTVRIPNTRSGRARRSPEYFAYCWTCSTRAGRSKPAHCRSCDPPFSPESAWRRGPQSYESVHLLAL